MIHQFGLWLITIKLHKNTPGTKAAGKSVRSLLSSIFCHLYCRRRLFHSKHMGDTSCRSAGVIMTEMMPSVVWTFG